MITKKVLQQFLNNSRTDIITFEDPKERLIYLLHPNPQRHKILTFLDLNMPTVFGWDILEELKNANAETIKKGYFTF